MDGYYGRDGGRNLKKGQRYPWDMRQRYHRLHQVSLDGHLCPLPENRCMARSSLRLKGCVDSLGFEDERSNPATRDDRPFYPLDYLLFFGNNEMTNCYERVTNPKIFIFDS